jgi:hypothetical protein
MAIDRMWASSSSNAVRQWAIIAAVFSADVALAKLVVASEISVVRAETSSAGTFHQLH